jgi:hypothetical protein
MTTVTLFIFSGRPDPKWQLADEDARALAERLRSVTSAPEASNLGYRGFLLESNDPGLPSTMIVRRAPEVERFLLRTGAHILSPEIARIVADAIK